MSCCNDCKHRHVCKYKEAADIFYEAVDKVIKNEDNDFYGLFTVEIKCKNYSWDYPKEWDQPGVKGFKFPSTITTTGTGTIDDPCEHCQSNPRNMPDHYVGDWPCQWCDKYPLKVTWESNK